MNILVTGANGLLGSSVMTELRRRVLGWQCPDEFDHQAKSRYTYHQRNGEQHDVEGVGQESEHVVVARLVAVPCPDQADADCQKAGDCAHDGLALA